MVPAEPIKDRKLHVHVPRAVKYNVQQISVEIVNLGIDITFNFG